MADTHPSRPDPTATKPHWLLAYIVAGAVAVLALLALVTAPIADLMGDSQHAIPAALHGISSLVYLIVATVLAYQGYLLYTDRLRNYHDIRILSALAAAFSLLTILFGNWIYIYYRAPGGPRAQFLQANPAIHEVFFEFKEYVALFTLPLAVAAAFIILHEGEHLRSRPLTRQAVGVLLVLGWVFLLLAFGLGAAITKLGSV